MKPLIWKELFENGRSLPLGWVIVTLACLLSLPSREYIESGLSSRLVDSLILLAPLMAFSLGLLQSYRDTQPAAGAYLQHRYVSKQQVFWSKMIAAMVIYFAAIVPPLMLLAGWISLRGLETYPMRAIEVLPALAYSMLAFSLHPTTLMMMTRSAHWLGTRCLPLVFAVVISGSFALMADRYALPMSIAIGLIAIVVVSWLSFTAQIFWHVPDTRIGRWLQVSYLSVCSILVVAFGVNLVMAIVGETQPRLSPYNTFELETTTGKPWLLTIEYFEDEQTRQPKRRVLGGAPIDGSPVIDPTAPIPGDEKFSEYGFGFLSNGENDKNHRDRFLRSADEFHRSKLQYFYDNRGYLLLYQAKPRVRWVQTIAADGVYASGQLTGKPFTRNPTRGFQSFFNAGYPRPLIDSNGIYIVDDDSGAIRTLINGPINSHHVTTSDDGSAPRILILSQGTISEYRLVDSSGSEDWYEAPPEGMKFEKLQSLARYNLSAELVQSAAVPSKLLERDYFGIAATNDGFVAVEADWRRRLYRLSPGMSAEVIDFALVPGTESLRGIDQFCHEIALCGLFPGLMFATLWSCNYVGPFDGMEVVGWTHAVWLNQFQASVFLSVFTTTCLLAILLIALVAWKYEISRRTTLGWCLSVPVLGLAAPLAMIAIYELPRREPCPDCGKSRRIKDPTCEHCGAQWEVPANEGIEISERLLDEAQAKTV